MLLGSGSVIVVKRVPLWVKLVTNPAKDVIVLSRPEVESYASEVALPELSVFQ